MKNLMNFFSMVLVLGGLAFMVSCSDNEDPIIAVVEGVNVGDGFYIAPTGVDAIAGGILKSPTSGDNSPRISENRLDFPTPFAPVRPAF